MGLISIFSACSEKKKIQLLTILKVTNWMEKDAFVSFSAWTGDEMWENIYYVDRRAVLVNLNCRHFCIHIHKMSDTEYILYNLWIHNADLCAISRFVKYIRFSQKPSQQYSFFCLRLRLSMKMILHLHARNLTYIIGDFYDISWMIRWEISSIS